MLILRRLFSALVLIVCFLCFRPVRMEGMAMQPSVRDGDLCLFLRGGKVRAGDIILMRGKDGSLGIGRAVAAAGDLTGGDAEGRYTVNGQALSDCWAEAVSLDGAPDGAAEGRIRDGELLVISGSEGEAPVLRKISAGETAGRLVYLLRRRGF